MGESKWVFKGVPCPDRLFCTNGGTCVYFPRLSTRACECATGFEGERCELKSIPDPSHSTAYTNGDHTLQVFLFVSNCLILITLIAILVALCRRLPSRSKKVRRKPADGDVDLEDGRFRSSGMRRFIGWTFKRDLTAKPAADGAFSIEAARSAPSRWNRVRELVLPGETTETSSELQRLAQRPSSSVVTKSRWGRVRETVVSSTEAATPAELQALTQTTHEPRRSRWSSVRETVLPTGSPSSTVTELNGLARSTLGSRTGVP